jgi:NCAIR mutase (PurE)-related protein
MDGCHQLKRFDVPSQFFLYRRLATSFSSYDDIHVVSSSMIISTTRRFLSSTTNNNKLPPPSNNNDNDDDILSSFANLDHDRASRTGFPEAVFGQGKTPSQIHLILDSMTRNVVLRTQKNSNRNDNNNNNNKSIIATRIDSMTYNAIINLGPLSTPHVILKYHELARILSVQIQKIIAVDDDATTSLDKKSTTYSQQSVVVACAGTTDLPVAEEAAITLELSGVTVIRVYDCGVAGLHRILKALPQLRHEDVGCVIVCAGMDGALPSVVGGLVDVPVVAVPTSVGYGASFNGVSALLTMLNSCSPGVGVVNIDNGFGGAVFAMKCLNSSRCSRR